MKRIFTFILLYFCFWLSFLSQVNPNNHYVNPYQRKDGTQVQGHYRTNSNNTNRDNYSTKGNTNPYTGKPGWVTPDNNQLNSGTYNYNGGSNNYGSSGYSGSSSYLNSGSNKIGFWSDFGMGGSIKFYINDQYAGELNNYFKDGSPNCNTYGVLPLNFENRIYNVKAIDSYGYYWNFNMNPSNTSCYAFKLQYSKSNKINIGKTYAYYMYKPRKYAFWTSFITTTLFPPAGLVATAGINIINPKKKISSDADFNKGYRRRASWMFFKKSALGFGLGLVGFAVINTMRG